MTTEQIARQIKTQFPTVRIKFDNETVAVCLGPYWFEEECNDAVSRYVDSLKNRNVFCCDDMHSSNVKLI